MPINKSSAISYQLSDKKEPVRSLPKGFTLVELLITISIISILSAIGMVAYSAVMKQGRDSKRQSDLRSIQSALEQFNSDQGYYPARRDDNTCPTGARFKISTPTLTCSLQYNNGTTTKIYLNQVPSGLDLGTKGYTYLPANNVGQCSNSTSSGSQYCDCVDSTGVVANCTKYCLYAALDNLASPQLNGCPSLSDSSYNFAVTPP